MKNSISLLSGVLLSSALFWGVLTQGQVVHSGEMFSVPVISMDRAITIRLALTSLGHSGV